MGKIARNNYFYYSLRDGPTYNENFVNNEMELFFSCNFENRLEKLLLFH